MGSDDQGSGSSPRTTAAELYSTGPATSTVAGPSVDVSTGISDVSQAQDYPAQMAGSMGSMSAPLSRYRATSFHTFRTPESIGNVLGAK